MGKKALETKDWPRGSEWRMWDLHVHSPASMVHNYDGSDPWPRFMQDLRELPPEMSVIGINDYLFVDGYEHVLAAWRAGDLPNLEAVFPIVEMRLDEFVGVEGSLGKINYHVLFEAALDPGVIQAQFINGIMADAHLNPELGSGPTWKGSPSRDNLMAFGAEIRRSIPQDRLPDFSESDLELGFNNLVVSIKEIDERRSLPALQGRTLSAVGRAEWAAMKWTGTGIAQKKDLINRVNFVFVAAESPAAHGRALQRLRDGGVMPDSWTAATRTITQAAGTRTESATASPG